MPRSSEVTREVLVAVEKAAKSYGRRAALAGLDLNLRRGEWTGLIGPNGAGKTTLMLAIAGLMPLDSGRITVLGSPVLGPRPDAIGWVPQGIALYAQLTGRENLEAFGGLHGLRGADLTERVTWALDWIGLESRAEERVATYSGGMQRRLNIACAVLHRPRILLLDEPTVGVDPQARLRLFAMLETLREDGVALLHSSHELGDIETTCDVLSIMDGGRVVATGTVPELVRDFVGEGSRVTLKLADATPGIAGLERQPGGRFTAQLDDVAEELPRLLAVLRESGTQVLGLQLDQPGLRDVFLGLTGKELRE